MSDRSWSDEVRRPPYEAPIDHHFKEVTLTCVTAAITLVVLVWLLAFGLTGWALALAIVGAVGFIAKGLITSGRGFLDG